MKAKLTYTSLTTWLLIAIFLGGCATTQHEALPATVSGTASPTATLQPTTTLTPVPSATSTPAPTATSSPRPTQTATASATLTPTPQLYSVLQPGNYLVYSACLAGDCQLDVLSLAGEHQGTLSNEVLLVGDISPDQKFLAFSNENGLLRILDFATHELVPFAALDEQCFAADWSPDGNYLVASCHGKVGKDLYVFSLQDGTHLRLIACEEREEACTFPVWSPDGKWIAYSRGPRRSGVSETRGLYLIDTACFAEPATCSDLGPFGLIVPLAWSPDSLYLAGRHGSTIRIFRMQTGSVSPVQDIETGDDLVEAIAWSPDGEWIAYSLRTKIYLISVSDWTQSLLYDADSYVEIFDWLTIPPGEE